MLALALVLVGSVSVAFGESCTIDIPRPLTFEQWKLEVQKRADVGIYPLIGINARDIRDGLAIARGTDCDEWADIWIRFGDGYLAKARTLATDKAAANANFLMAWRFYNFARWPTLLSDRKRFAWVKAQEAFGEHGKLMDPPVQTVRISFDGHGDIVGFMRQPKSESPSPLVITIGGLDGWRDDMIDRFAGLPAAGFAYIAVDAPGTGDSPVTGTSPDADAMFKRLIDWASAQPSIDKTRIFVHGGSFGGYWAARTAIVEAGRLRGVIDQSGPTDIAFDGTVEAQGKLTNSFYLSDYQPSISRMLGTSGLADSDREWHMLSLRKRGLIGRPTAPMLIVGGAKDPLVPLSDLWLMLAEGRTPKQAWINPEGYHMGRTPGVWTDETLLQSVMLPWLKAQAGLPN